MLVGLIGYKNSGKTSIAKKYGQMFDPHLNMIGFSNPLYKMLGVLGITEEEIQDKPRRELPDPRFGGRSIQYALNSLGTDWGRKMIYENIWVDRALDAMIPSLTNIADNVRFPNEFDAVRKRNGFLIAIVNPKVGDDGTAPEKHIKDLQEKADVKIYNDPDLIDLAQLADNLRQMIDYASIRG
ncbi:deoxynucleotide monophosphate kinase protein [Rhizobium phage RHph_Y68]|uniref:Deoxynucleotide monophosphate kinase protein n=1 Tax=Rhizobium phage RHph_Y68 TaxID=2509787 RepID=A0A7S5R3D0_9CAUD|nr:deoxynucleoside monophosphate kinase [Rhizobium phage RHph_Y68]QIG68071.1 deoxynucleotide monophosphate kinase protein [Rhizobium phage RHph_Y68]